MKKVISYRQKLIGLANIYQINRILNPDLKLTTYEIELELLKNKVPIPSRRGYFSHKIVNEFSRPLYTYIKEKFTIDLNLKSYSNKLISKAVNSLKEKLSINFSLNRNFSLNKNLKIIFNKIKNYFRLIIYNTDNFFKVLTKTIIESLNDIYHFKFEERLVKKFILRGVYSFLVVMLVSSGFYIKSLITNVDGLKISVEIKSEKKQKVQTPNIPKKNKSKDLVKKPETSKRPYDPENDYT